jgi:anti-anti-sigma factor
VFLAILWACLAEVLRGDGASAGPMWEKVPSPSPNWRNPFGLSGGFLMPEEISPFHRPWSGCKPCLAMPGAWGLIWTAEGLVAHGEIDLHTATAFEAQASEAVSLSTAGTFLIDLSGVTFMDSAGLRALIRVLEFHDGQRIIVQPSPQVFTLLHLSGLTNGDLPNVWVREPQPD